MEIIDALYTSSFGVGDNAPPSVGFYTLDYLNRHGKLSLNY